MSPKVNLNDRKADPVTEFGLSLGYSSVCSENVFRNNPSAGGNAGSLSFVSANPVSELVWYPQGLTLKCADCCFMDRRPSHLLGVGPGSSVYSTPRAKRMDNADIVSMKYDVATPPEGTPDSKIGKGPINEVDADNDAPDVGNSRNGDHKNDLYNQAKRILKPDEKTPLAFPCRNIGRIIELLQNEPAPGDHNSDEQASGCCSKKQGMEISLDAAISPLGKINDIDAGILFRPVENDEAGNPSVPLSEKLESTDENDLREADSQSAGGATIEFASSESSSEVKSKSIQGMQNQLNNLIPVSNRFPKNGGVLQSHWENKERALFDANADKRLLKEKANCHESVESCNSAMVVKKRWRFDQRPFVGSKKAKLIHNQHLASGFNGQESSFMNWISSMMKGLSGPTLDAGAPLSFTFSSPGNGPEEDVHMHMLEQNMRHAGFKSFFQSIYLPSQKHPEMGISLSVNEARTISPPTERVNEVCTTGDDPIPCHEGIDNVGKQLLLLNKEFSDDTSEIVAGPSSLPLGVDGHVAGYKQESEAYLGEDEVAISKDALITSSSSLLEHGTTKAESTEEKAPQFGCKGDSGRLWIKHFSSKAHCSLLKQDDTTEGHGNATYGSRNSVRTLVQSPQSCGLENNPGNAARNECHVQELVRAAGKELPTCQVGTEFSVGFARAESCREEDNVRKVNVMLPSECLKSSEEMASAFSRRLDALKRHISTTTTTKSLHH